MNVCILIRTKPGKVKKVLDSVKKVAGIDEVFPTFGRYDIVVLAFPSTYDIARELARKVSQIRGVKSIETLIESV